MQPSAATKQRIVDAFADVGHAAREAGVLSDAATTFADQLVAEGHTEALGEITAAFWSANAARLARRDRWKVATVIRAGLDPGEQEPPPPPPTKPVDPEPQPNPPTEGDT